MASPGHHWPIRSAPGRVLREVAQRRIKRRGGQILWHKQCFATIYSKQRTLSALVESMTLRLTANIYSPIFQNHLRPNASLGRYTWHKVTSKMLNKPSIGYSPAIQTM